jgi:hypothetical protein
MMSNGLGDPIIDQAISSNYKIPSFFFTTRQAPKIPEAEGSANSSPQQFAQYDRQDYYNEVPKESENFRRNNGQQYNSYKPLK